MAWWYRIQTNKQKNCREWIMPTYLYLCPEHGEFEEYHSISFKLEKCPLCEKENKITEVKDW